LVTVSGSRLDFQGVQVDLADDVLPFLAGGDADPHIPQIRQRVWAKIDRTANTLDGFMSTDGTTFTEIDAPHNYDFLRPVTYAGIAATAHQDGTYVTGMVDGNSLQIAPLP
jgi:hypothetical protein